METKRVSVKWALDKFEVRCKGKTSFYFYFIKEVDWYEV